MVLKEYSLLKIAEAVEAGPALRDLMGFDLLIYPATSCIEFGMETCQPLESLTS